MTPDQINLNPFLLPLPLPLSFIFLSLPDLSPSTLFNHQISVPINMSVPPKYAGIKLSESSAQNTPHTLEICMYYTKLILSYFE